LNYKAGVEYRASDMRAYYRSRIKNIIGQERVTEMIMWVTLFLLSPAELWSQLSADFNVNADIVCSGSSVTFTDNSGGTTDETQYLWNFGTGANPSSATGAGPHNVLYEGSGSSTVILTITQWPFDSDTDTGVIQIATLPETPTATVIQPGCITQSGTIVFNEQSDMEYSIAAGYQESEIFSGLIPGNYTLSVKNKDAPGCESFAESTITINAVPSPPEPIRGLASVCVGSTTQLLSSPSGGIWTSSNPSTVSVDNNGLVTGLLSGLTVISYTLGTDCSVSAEVSVISIPSQPEDFMVSSQEVCQGISDVAYSVPNDTGVTYNWNFSGSGVTITGTGNAVSLSFSAEASSGSLSVSASNSCGASIPRSTAITLLTRDMDSC